MKLVLGFDFVLNQYDGVDLHGLNRRHIVHRFHLNQLRMHLRIVGGGLLFDGAERRGSNQLRLLGKQTLAKGASHKENFNFKI